MKEDRADKAIAYAHKLFSLRPRSERELKDRLFRKGFDRTAVERVISFLKKKDIIDDFKFAKLWIESRMHANPKGNMLLRKELRDKGVSASIIDKALAEKGEKEDSIVKIIAAQRLERLKGLPKQKAKKRLFDFLARRGFDFDVIDGVLKEIFD